MSLKKTGLILFSILIIIGVFIANNFNSGRQPKTPDKNPEKDFFDSIQVKFDAEIKSDETKEPAPDKLSKKSNTEKTSPPKNLLSHTTQKIICPLRTEPMLYIILIAEIKFDNEEDKKTAARRSNDVESVIQNVLFNYKREDLNAPLIKKDISSSLEELLPGLSVNDIFFKDFKIEIRKK